MSYDELLAEFRADGASLRCAEVKKLLVAAGFRVKDGALGGHKTFSHPLIPAFFGSNYDCGHGRNPELKRIYIRKIRNVLVDYEEELRALLDVK